MSFRRPATAAGSRKPHMPPPISILPPRTKSALGKSSTSATTTLSEDTFPYDEVEAPSPSRTRPKKPALISDDDSNIHVVIRCRRRSEQEVQDASPVIVTTNGPRGEDITIETAAPSSVLGVVTLPPTRTYPFDRVFGPEADQAMIYNDVVAPILDQVLMGYNCTLFAYGQTGTGKTHTMQGDLAPSHLGNPSPGAGMIPRALFKLFQHLEAHVPDYSVKVSFVELYNEELRDLLAPEMTVPLGNAQPMSIGSGQLGLNQVNPGLRIFDDASKRGVFIQGLEEAAVKNAADAIALLTKGSQRRQIAATKFNDHSSRSHSVFSITVHSKETSTLGDDLLKVGKLNLVDLAGSENIGRSGAENKRAREAGMINQSLLTLGRVINALVEKSSHVPYRESKLTRLLQDSLGGRTKTCIIATVSPARCNLEETLSTLEYALRAKSIRNKPEINQRLTKNALIKEYVSEIERLKADLLAAREMNGIYFSQDSWDQISAENETRKAQHDEAKRQVIIAESQLGAVREEFEQSMALLLKREDELKATKATLEATTSELHNKVGELETVKEVLEEEVVVRGAHQETEKALDGIATGLKTTVERSVKDIRGLFDKLGRKSSVAGGNAQAVSEYGKLLNAEIILLNTRLEEFSKAQDQLNTTLQSSLRQFQATETEDLAAHSGIINEQLSEFTKYVELLQSDESVSNEAMETIRASFKDVGEVMKSSFGMWSSGLRRSCETLCNEVQVSGISSAVAVEKALKAMTSVSEHIIRGIQEHNRQENEADLELEALARDHANSEIHRLRQQNSLLTQLLHDEKTKSERARDEFIQRVSGLLGEYTEARDQSLREAVSHMRHGMSAGEMAADNFVATHGSQLEVGMKRRRDWEESLEKHDAEGMKARGAGFKALGNVTACFNDGLTVMQANVANSVVSQMAEVDQQVKNMTIVCSEAFDKLDRIKRIRVEATETLGTDAEIHYRVLQQGLTSTSNHIEQTISTFMNEISNLQTSTKSYHNTAATQLSNLKHTTRSLVEQGTREDIATGTTPHKRHWEYPDHWELTRPREEVLREWRGLPERVASSEGCVGTIKVEGQETRIRDLDVPFVDRASAMDLDIMPKEEQAAPMRYFTPPSESSSSSPPLPKLKSVRAGGFGKLTKVPGLGSSHTLRERPTNLLPHGSRKPR